MIRRAYVDAKALQHAEQGGVLSLDQEAAHRFTRVLRLEAGAEVELFDGAGRMVRGKLSLNEPISLTDLVVENVLPEGPRLVVVQALCKMDKLEQVVQRVTELGAHEIILFDAERSVVDFKGKAEQKVERLSRIAQDAARQSLRVDVPTVSGPMDLSELIQLVGQSKSLALVGDLDGSRKLSEILRERAEDVGQGVTILVGPEGGFSERETEALRAKGALSTQWAPHVLRTETAAMAAMAIVQARLGRA